MKINEVTTLRITEDIDVSTFAKMAWGGMKSLGSSFEYQDAHPEKELAKKKWYDPEKIVGQATDKRFMSADENFTTTFVNMAATGAIFRVLPPVFKKIGGRLFAFLPGAGIAVGAYFAGKSVKEGDYVGAVLELGLGALLGPTSRIALKKWIDSLGNFVRKTGGGDDVLLSVADDVMADMFSLSNRTNVQVHPSGVVGQIDQAEGTEFVEQFVKDHGRSPSDKEIIHWAQNKGNALDNPIDIGPEGRVQKIKDNVVEMEIMGPADRVSEFGEYPACLLYTSPSPRDRG